ncbi:MAG: hypothetical protein HYZ75_08870 [Elusimicrobia bacterium]|nr:hypothetical protein [Elusimicrobiota bacterium]
MLTLLLSLLCAVAAPARADDDFRSPDGWRKRLKIEGQGGAAAKLLDAKYDGVADKTTFRGVFDSMEKTHGLRFVFDKDVDLSREHDSSHALGMPLGKFLLWLARWNDIAYRWEDGAIRVSRRPFWEHDLNVDGIDDGFRKRLRETVSIKAEGTPPAAVIEEAGRLKGFSVRIGTSLAKPKRQMDGEMVDYPVGKLLWDIQGSFDVAYRWEKGVLWAEAPELGANGMGMSISSKMKAVPAKPAGPADPLDKPLFPGFLDADIAEVAGRLSTKTGLRFELDPALAGERLSIAFGGAAVRDYLAVLHDLHGIGHLRRPDGAVELARRHHKKEVRLLAPAPALAPDPRAAPKIEGKAGKTAALLEKKPTLAAKASPMPELFAGLGRQSGLDFRLDAAAGKAGTVTGRYEGAALGRILAQLAGLFQLGYRWEGDAIRVSRPEGLPEASAAFTSRGVFDSDLSVDRPEDRTLDLVVKDADLVRVLDLVSARTGRRFEPDASVKDARVTLALREARLDELLAVLHDEYKIGSRWVREGAIPVSRSLFSEARRCRRREGRAMGEERFAREQKRFEQQRAARRPVQELSDDEDRARARSEYEEEQAELERRCGKAD